MDGNFKPYDWTASAKRIDEILNQPAGQFEETNSLPSRDKLTYTNGFYANCTALFIDIRGSSTLTTKHKRPVLAKIYRAFISEMVAVLNSDRFVREVSIVGDCVWAVYDTPHTTDIDDVFSVAAKANTLIALLNARYEKRNIDPLKIGIGIDWGRALMIKAGYSGSGINDVIYMGDVVNRAAHLAHKAGRGIWGSSSHPIWVGGNFWGNLNDHNQGLLTGLYDSELGYVYTGHVVNSPMEEWVEQNG
ncbi:adenylate/guanylate cyclase domain-containing protein [Rhodococcus koreensis]